MKKANEHPLWYLQLQLVCDQVCGMTDTYAVRIHGELLELNVNDYERPMPRPVMMAMSKMADESTPAPISEGMSTVAITVVTRWRFVK